MVEGSPLRYTFECRHPHQRSHQGDRLAPTEPARRSELFRPYLEEVRHTNDYYPFTTYVRTMAEEGIAPPPLHSPQLSDSDGSISSVDSPKQKTLKCCWRNCGLHFGTLDQLAAHVGKVHGASGPAGLFYCGWEGCTRNDRAFNARYKMLVHVRTHTNEKPHQCYQCDKSFSRAENLKIHIRSHSGEKPYACPVPGCNKAYSNSSDRFKHTRTHQDDKPYQCKVPGCSKRYTDPSSLRKHVKTYKHYATTATAATDESFTLNLNTLNQCESNMAAVCDIADERCIDQSDYATDYKENYNWSGLIGARMFASYDVDMDGDTPLDLSLSRNT